MADVLYLFDKNINKMYIKVEEEEKVSIDHERRMSGNAAWVLKPLEARYLPYGSSLGTMSSG